MKIEFEWDEDKNSENIKKRGISFEKVVKVFDDDLAIPFEDPNIAMKTKRDMV